MKSFYGAMLNPRTHVQETSNQSKVHDSIISTDIIISHTPRRLQKDREVFLSEC